MCDRDYRITPIYRLHEFLDSGLVFRQFFTERYLAPISSLALESFSEEIFLVDSWGEIFEFSHVVSVSQDELDEVCVVESVFLRLWKTELHSIE